MLDEVLAGVVEPMRIVDHQQLWYSATHLFVGFDDGRPEIVGRVSSLGHNDNSGGRAGSSRWSGTRRSTRPRSSCARPARRS